MGETPAALPRFETLEAAPGWTAVDFISDLHLSEQTPRTFECWAHYLRGTPASAVIILGDLFEVWVGDDARHAGFEARCAAVLAEAAARRAVTFTCGNRDFLVGDAMLAECGVRALPDPAVLVAFGRRFLLSHGDALCLADHDYQVFRALVRGAPWQRDFLARPLEERQQLARQMRDHSEQRKHGMAVQDWVDIDQPTALRWMRAARTPVLIHGHTHRPAHESLAPGYAREVLSDWDCEGAHGAPRAEVLRLTPDGALTRLPIVHA
ncbi:UDP-2,3-diacylglucosamine diphosphatase [Piscinibacter sp.]|uniref:UDP-2,3-diacylglucosamine diphosphatase n=1 Tax=Piscinibacter sp. TaxID=1903157 RepID=UPI0039E253F1